MGRLVFTSGEILTAANMNELSDQAVMVFAGTGERDTAIPSPSEGMVTYLEDSNELELYDGSSWLRVAPDATTSTPGVVTGTTSNSDENTALGSAALESNTTGSNNTAVGLQAMQDNTEGINNTAVGLQAMQDNTTASNNTVSGFRALRINTTGLENVAVGAEALGSSTTADDNVAVGAEALGGNTTGIRNTAVGYRAGDGTTTGDNNVSLGAFADPSSDTASNEVTLGSAAITSLRCNQTTISSLSDVRDKTDIETTALGLEVINKVRPVEFTWARRDGTMGDTPDLGFIAQELAEVEDDLGETDRLRLTLRNNPEKLEAAPGRLLPVLVKAVQELSAQNDELRARLDAVEGK